MVRKKKVEEKGKDGMNSVILWAPRILMIIYIAMLNYFALSGGLAGITKIIIVIFLLIFLIIAWQREIIGGFVILAFGFSMGVFFGAFSDPRGFGFLVLPIWLIGILFLVSHKINN
jgi:hypothetical protein